MVVHGRPKTPKNTSFLGSPSPQGLHSPYILGDTTRPGCVTCVLVWSKSDRRRLRKTLHKQTDRQTNRHYENNGHLAVNQYIQSKSCISYCCSAYKIQLLSFHSKLDKHAWHYKATNKKRSDSLGGNDRLLYDFLITLWWHTFRIRPSCKETRHCCNYKPEHTKFGDFEHNSKTRKCLLLCYRIPTLASGSRPIFWSLISTMSATWYQTMLHEHKAYH